VLGNHDYQGSIQAQLDYVYLSARWCLPARYHAVEKAINATASALLVFLDTSPFLSSYQANGPEYIEGVGGQDPEWQLSWLQRTLAASKAAWKLVFGHHPIYSASPYHGDTLELQSRLLRFCKRITCRRTSAGMSTTFNISPPTGSIISCLGQGLIAGKASGAAVAATASLRSALAAYC
jgi:tartrate-resistant acid phosphatase type 5